MSDENAEVLDLEVVERGSTWLREMLGDVSRQTAGKQIAIGGASGWCAGYLFVKVGKIAAATLGTTVLILQIAQHKGYIHINWNNVNRETERVRRHVEQTASRQYSRLGRPAPIQQFIKQNIFLAGGFAGGFLLALAC